MTPETRAALVGAGAAILASVLSAIATYRAALVGFQVRRTQAQLRKAYQSLEFFREMESYYIERIIQHSGGTHITHHREAREAARAKLGRDLHSVAEPARLRAALQRLADI